MVVVGDDPQLAVGGVDRYSTFGRRAATSIGSARRIVGGDEAHFAGSYCRRCAMKIRLSVVRAVDADREADVLGLLVERHAPRPGRRRGGAARLVAAPMLVDLGEDDALAVAGPDRLADADVGDGFDVARRWRGRGCASLNRSEPSSSTKVASSLPSGADRDARRGGNNPCPRPRRPRRRSVRRSPPPSWLAEPLAVLRAGLERPPISTSRRRFSGTAGSVFLDPPLHLLEQRVDQRLVRRHRRFEISVLGLQIGEHVIVGDIRDSPGRAARPRGLRWSRHGG